MDCAPGVAVESGGATVGGTGSVAVGIGVGTMAVGAIVGKRVSAVGAIVGVATAPLAGVGTTRTGGSLPPQAARNIRCASALRITKYLYLLIMMLSR